MIVCVALGCAAEGAAGKPRRADLKVSGAALSSVPAAGERVIVRATVRNTGKAAARASLVSVALQGMRAPLARVKVAKLKRGKKLTVSGSTMGTRDDFLGAYGLVRSGRVRVHVDSTFPLSEIRAAHERLEAGEQLGKIVLTIP